LAGKQALDVGCGGGILAESMALRGAQVLGIDMGEAPLAVARLHQLESGAVLDYRRVTAEELAENESGRFDVVTCMEMLEHVPDPASTIQRAPGLVKPGGHVFFSTINRNPKSYLFAIIGAEYVLRMLPQGTHDFRKFIRPSELDRWTARRWPGHSASHRFAFQSAHSPLLAGIGRYGQLHGALPDGLFRMKTVPPACVLFDLDGTLLDTAPDLAAALNRLRRARGESELPLDAIRPTISQGSPGMLKLGFGLTPDDPLYPELNQRFLELYREFIAVETVLFPGMGEVLTYLEANRIRWGVVTNKPGWLTEPLMKALESLVAGGCVVSGDTLSKRKPDPEPLWYACEQVGRSAGSLAVCRRCRARHASGQTGRHDRAGGGFRLSGP
jgi:ubiquinone biosynthesis O-methyltransferase